MSDIVISDIVDGILDDKAKLHKRAKELRDEAKEKTKVDEKEVAKDLKDIAAARGSKSDPEEKRVPAVPHLNATTDKINILVRKFMANVADASLQLDEKQLEEIEKDLNSINISTSTTILRCKGADKCVYGKLCSLKVAGKYPIGGLCPLEKAVADVSFEEYVRSLNLAPQEIGIIEFNQIMALIDCDLQDMRARTRLNEDGMTRMVITFVNSKTGDQAENEDVSLMFGIREKVSKRKDQLLKQLLATPEIRAKYKVADFSSQKKKDTMQLVNAAREKLIKFREEDTGKDNGTEQ